MRPYTVEYQEALMLHRGILLSLALLVLGSGAATAQKVEITPFVGLRYGGEVEDQAFGFDTRGLEFDEGASSGLVVSFPVRHGLFVELIWSHQATELVDDRGFLEHVRLFDVDVDYYHAGVTYQWTLGQVRPFAGFSIGGTLLDPDVAGADSDTRLSIGLNGGAKLMLNQHFGFRLEGVLFVTDLGDGNRFCRNCYYDDSNDMAQGELRGGVVFAF